MGCCLPFSNPTDDSAGGEATVASGLLGVPGYCAVDSGELRTDSSSISLSSE